MEGLAMNVMELKLPETSKFAKDFNYVGSLWAKANDPALSEEDRKAYEDAYWSAKYCLEQGLPV